MLCHYGGEGATITVDSLRPDVTAVPGLTTTIVGHHVIPNLLPYRKKGSRAGVRKTWKPLFATDTGTW